MFQGRSEKEATEIAGDNTETWVFQRTQSVRLESCFSRSRKSPVSFSGSGETEAARRKAPGPEQHLDNCTARNDSISRTVLHEPVEAKSPEAIAKPLAAPAGAEP